MTDSAGERPGRRPGALLRPRARRWPARPAPWRRPVGSGVALGGTPSRSATDLVTELRPRRRVGDRRTAARSAPDDAIVGEEGTSRRRTSGYAWFIDPIDGTTNFVYDLPTWSTLGRRRATTTRCSPAPSTCPPLDELFAADCGGGAHAQRHADPVQHRDRPRAGAGRHRLQLSPRARGAPQAARLAGMIGEIRDIRRMGSAAIDLCFVAAGSARRLLRAIPQHLGLGSRRTDRHAKRARSRATSPAGPPARARCSPPHRGSTSAFVDLLNTPRAAGAPVMSAFRA